MSRQSLPLDVDKIRKKVEKDIRNFFVLPKQKR